MVSFNKDFFIVIDKNPLHVKKDIYTLYLFYLKKKAGRQLIYSGQPFFKGEITFGFDFKNKIRPVFFEKYVKKEKKPIDPKLFKQFLNSEYNKFLAISDKTNLEDLEPLMKMLNALHYKNIEKLTLCDLCIVDNKFTLLDTSEVIHSHNNKSICKSCSLNIIENELKVQGVAVNPKLKDFIKHLILKFKNVSKILSSFSPNFNPLKNTDLTLYDVIEKEKSNKKIKTLKIDDIDIPSDFKSLLKKEGYTELLPIQTISVETGLLDIDKFQDLMIVSSTSSGKTLIAELAGIKKIINNKNAKMLYVVPIVALANMRFEEFKLRYKSLGIKVAIRVGKSIIGEDYSFDEGDIKSSQIIIATYEAIDYHLRSGDYANLGEFKTIVIDEVQTLGDHERGFTIDGFISRLKSLFPIHNCQYLYLSATIGNPTEISKNLTAKLITYNERPVPVERHLLLCLNEHKKNRHMSQLIRNEFKRTSKYGFRGQTIVFTNSRKNCHSLADYFNGQQQLVEAYHAGLTYREKKEIETKFIKQKISAVVTTAALAAGVDFPASQVLFDSLSMGIKWLQVSEFEQMIGRAGRLKKHDLGKIYLMVIPNRIYNLSSKEPEEKIAIRLLTGKLEPVEVPINEDRMLTELLAFISMKKVANIAEIELFHENLVNNNYFLENFLDLLLKKKLIKNENNHFKITPLGIAISKAFLTIDKVLDIKDQLFKEKIPIETIALNLEPIRNVYVSNKIVSEVSKNINAKYVSNQLFSGTILSILESRNINKRKNFPKFLIEILTKWTNSIFLECECKESPYCECGKNNLQNLIFSWRVEKKFTIDEIFSHLLENFEILIYRGDLIDFFENLIHSFETIRNICEAMTLNDAFKNKISKIPDIIETIKEPFKTKS